MRRRTIGTTAKWRIFRTGFRAVTAARERSPARLKATELTLATMLVLGLSAPGAFAYDFQKSITIDRSKIADASCGGTLTQYPMLFSVIDADLAHTGSGGDVTDLGGDDIIFVGLDAATCGGPSSCILAHEIERYDNATGELVAWVRVPVVNTNAAASDTVIYVQYGDATVTTPTENPTGVWANYAGVWHLEEQVAGTHDDSTGTQDGTRNGNSVAPGKIAAAQDFDGGDVVLVSDHDAFSFGNGTTDSPFSVSAWV